MLEQTVSIPAADGSALAATWVLPEGPGPFPALLCVHGLTLDQGMFADFGMAMAQRGLASLRVDLRGQGKSGGRLQDQGFKDQLADVSAAFAAMAGQPGADPARLGLLGFSMGASFAALLAANEPRAKALALWSPLLRTGFWNDERRNQYGAPKDGLQEIWDGIQVSERLFSEAMLSDPYAAALGYAGPFFVCHGGKDKNHPQSASVELAAARQSAAKPVASCFPPTSGHHYRDPQGRALRDGLTAAFFAASL